ncbi:Protein FAM210B [Anabarilius grahami]|uniref:Protein FAM210B n=1 Tax=Anabarilius grahami TaxID=495550 RepID=A0A3N0XY94_ANAGA|nr:Protein FAM210B [Anabarilius grahami]
MFRSVSGASLLLQRLNLQLDASCSLRNYRAMRCCRVYRRLSACKAVLFRACSLRLEREIPFGSSSVLLVARARMAAFALNAPREYRDSTNEVESLLSARSPAAVIMQTRRASSTPEKTRDERAANVQTDHVSSVSSAEGQGSEGKPSKTQQLRKVFKEYGAVGVSFHIGISLISLGIFYLAVSSGLDMTALLCRLGFSESLVQSKLATGTSTFVLAYAVHKLFAPLRISITLVSVPLIVRHLRKTGLFKPRTSGPRWSCEAHYTALLRPSVCPLYGPHGYVQIGDSDRPLGPDAVRKRFSKPTEEEAAPARPHGSDCLRSQNVTIWREFWRVFIQQENNKLVSDSSDWSVCQHVKISEDSFVSDHHLNINRATFG